MPLVARTYPDPQFIEPNGRVRADAIAIRTPEGETIAGELVLRQLHVFPTPTRFDESLTGMGYRRSGGWRRCVGEVGDEWETEVVPC
jgi:hypothetical protein